MPRPNWDTLRKYAPIRQFSAVSANAVDNTTSSSMVNDFVTNSAIITSSDNIVMLKTPPIGNQGIQGSCVGWAVGYSAMSILNYSKYCDWSTGERSPSYVFNQIPNNNCTGSQIMDALNLVKNKGACSLNLMHYNENDCNTQPNAASNADAGQNKALNWVTLNINDTAGMKQALNLGYPIVIGIKVYQSFEDLNSSNAIWSSNTGNYLGNHAICIIGYDDNQHMFKVQNQWGAFWGNNGFCWIPYSFIARGAITEAYILYFSPCKNVQ